MCWGHGELRRDCGFGNQTDLRSSPSSAMISFAASLTFLDEIFPTYKMELMVHYENKRCPCTVRGISGCFLMRVT